MDGKNRILARRARFVGSALTILGCSPATPHGETTVAIAPGDVSSAPPPPSATVADPDAGTKPKPPPTNLPFAVPAGVSSETRLRYERLGKSAMEMQERQAKVEAELAQTPASWRDFAGELEGLFQSVGWFGYPCPDPPRPETDAFLKVLEDQRKVARERTERIKKDAEAKLSKGGKNGAKELERYTNEFDVANPRPCLSIACDRW